MLLALQKNEIAEIYKGALIRFLNTIRRLDDDGKLYDFDMFQSVVAVALTRFGFAASDLARDEDISKGAISKWLNEGANPNTPTKKAVVNWIIKAATEQINAL